MNDDVLERLVSELAEKNVKILRNEELIGESGVKHRFPLVVIKEERKMVFDFIDPKKPPEISALAIYIKAFDVKASKCFLMVDKSGGSEELKDVIPKLDTISLELVSEKNLKKVVKKLLEDF